MTTFTDIRSSVISLTNRPDLVAEMKVAIRKATMKFHLFETFKRDITKTTLDMSLYPITDGNFRWEFNLSDQSLFPRYRKVDYVQVPPSQWNAQPSISYPLTSIPGNFGWPIATTFQQLAANDIIDSYHLERSNYFFQTGMTLTIRSNYAPTQLEVGYYQYPGVVDAGNNLLNLTSWIADQFPDAIAEEAAAQIFKMIGKDEEFQRFQAFFAENAKMCQETDIG